MKVPPAIRVPAWEDDWRARLSSRLASRGFATISAFADSHPRASRNTLTDELSVTLDVGGTKPARDLAPVQILWALLDEANSSNTVEHRARDLFVRDLDLPEGWPPPEPPEAGKRLIRALTSWAGGIGTHLTAYDEAANNLADALLADESIPVGWVPTSADDPLLVELFRRHWREPSDENHSTADPR